MCDQVCALALHVWYTHTHTHTIYLQTHTQSHTLTHLHTQTHTYTPTTILTTTHTPRTKRIWPGIWNWGGSIPETTTTMEPSVFCVTHTKTHTHTRQLSSEKKIPSPLCSLFATPPPLDVHGIQKIRTRMRQDQQRLAIKNSGRRKPALLPLSLPCQVSFASWRGLF